MAAPRRSSAALLALLALLTLLNHLPSASLASAPRQPGNTRESWLDGQLKALDPNYRPSSTKRRHRKDGSAVAEDDSGGWVGETAKDDARNENKDTGSESRIPITHSQVAPAEAQKEAATSEQKASHSATGEEREEQAGGDRRISGTSPEGAVYDGGNKAVDAAARSASSDVGKSESNKVESGASRAKEDGVKVGTTEKRHGRLSRLPTNCDKFTLSLSPSMQKKIDHREFFDGYAEVDINDAKRYKIIRKIGKGQQGLVVGAIDLVTGEEVAIKKCTNFLGLYNGTSVLKEVVVMQNLVGADGMVQLRATLPTAAHIPATLSALYIVMERMDVDMSRTIKVTSKMELQTQTWLIYQMISALRNLHAAGVVHQDISVWNIMTRRDCTVKLVDFGYAAPIRRTPPIMPYSHVEVTVPLPGHPGGGVTSPELDIWYMGMSILAMASGEYYFRLDGGRTDDKLISAWLAEYGEPPSDMLPWFKPEALALLETARQEAKQRKAAGSTAPPHTLQSLFPAVHPAIIRLVHRMMNWHLSDIPTAGELLRDPLFDEIYSLMGPRILPERYGPALLKYDKIQAFDAAGFLSAMYNRTATADQVG